MQWATLLARTFDIDIKACARSGATLEVRAVVTDHDVARKLLAALPPPACAPPTPTPTPIVTAVVPEPVFA